MTEIEIKKNIRDAILGFAKSDLKTSTEKLFNALGYNSKKKATIDFDTLKKRAALRNILDVKYSHWSEWKSANLVFQITVDEVKQENSLFEFNVVKDDLIQSYLFFAVELKENNYSRGILSQITRFINRLYDMPVLILFKHGNLLTFSVINRRLNVLDHNKDVLEKVTLIKDILIPQNEKETTHRAHIEILYDLHFSNLLNEKKQQIKNFEELHKAWQKTLNIKALNDKFYKDVACWFFWAVKNVEFPYDDPYYEKRDTRNSENVIRLLTRIIFCWFMKEKELITNELFEESIIEKLLIEDADKTGSTYYKAILQNLFFATLNIPVNKRKFIEERTFQGKNINHFDHSVFRYKRYFKPNTSYLEFFKTIPFLNGGLFECQDYKIKEGEKETTIRVDCFSDNPKNETRLKVSNDIFFANPSKEPWLNDIFGTKNKEYHVQGIFKILNNYKFTIQENTPLEQEIALEPDLLGIVFENLLASYNPETRETARSKTGSFYTPREIVNYMVDESLLSYLKQKLNYEIPDIKLLNLFKPIEIDVSLSNIEKNKIINAIETIKILDPACGSGAFPMGILQRLVNLLHKVDHDNELWKERILQRTPVEIRPEATKVLKGKTADYIRKLGLIQNCIYGVDIQPIAVEISKLRFFLSLLVDFVKTDNAEDNWGIEPLPNLDFKVMQGDSLMEEFNGVSLSILPVEKSSTINFIDEEFHKKIDLLYEKQSLFLRETHPSKKNVLKEAVNNSLMDIFHYHLQIIKATYFFELKRIEENKKRITDEEAAENYYLSEKSKIDRKFGFNYLKFEKDLKELISGKKPRKFFSFSLFFAEVYENGGFDIVIGNPPYYQLSKDKTLPESYKQYLKDHFQTSGGRLNTFIFFMHQGLQLLKEYGNLIYIIPNTLLTQEYYKDTRKHLLECSHINQIVHYPTMQFENAVVENITIQYEKSKIKKPTKLLVQNLNEITLKGEIDLIEEAKSPNFNFNLSENSILDKMDNQDHYLLSDLCDINQAIALKGDKSLSLKSSNPNGKYYKLLDGRNINKYTINWNGVYLDFNIDMIHSCKRKDIFESNEKLMFRRVSSTLIFTYDAYQYFALNTIVVLNKKSKNVDLKFLLGLLNSSLINYYYIEKFKSTKKVFSEIQARTIGKLPIQKKQNKSITQIVDYLLIIGKFKSESASFLFFQKVIDAIVYELYFPEIVKEVDCDILQHLKVLPGLKDDDDDGNIKIIEKLYKEFSHSTHPISSALLRMSNIEEIQIIESRK